MSLKVTSEERKAGVFVVSPTGSLDTNTYNILEEKVDYLIKSSPSVIAFDMEYLDYISSMGVRVVLKTKKEMEKIKGSMIMTNLKPQIKKVFDIINALPSMSIFASMDELDNYLDLIQRKETT